MFQITPIYDIFIFEEKLLGNLFPKVEELESAQFDASRILHLCLIKKLSLKTEF